MIILAIDPGSTQSGWCRLPITPGKEWCGVLPNVDLIAAIRDVLFCTVLVIERFACYGMTIGQETIDAIEWGGAFKQTSTAPVITLFRREVKLAITGSPKANDAAIRQAIIDKFGGKENAIGSKSVPGPLRCVKADAWSALALAFTYQQRMASDFHA